jgi:hypothetical protein
MYAFWVLPEDVNDTAIEQGAKGYAKVFRSTLPNIPSIPSVIEIFTPFPALENVVDLASTGSALGIMLPVGLPEESSIDTDLILTNGS